MAASSGGLRELPPQSPRSRHEAEYFRHGSHRDFLARRVDQAEQSFLNRSSQMTMRYRNSGLVISLVVAACTAGCSSLPAPGAGDRPQIQSSAAHAACFYSDRSGADRLAGGRVVHWCGPEPKALF
jgi:hypothetical protein